MGYRYGGRATTNLAIIDANGRVYLPKAFRDKYQLHHGTKVESCMTEEGVLLKVIQTKVK